MAEIKKPGKNSDGNSGFTFLAMFIDMKSILLENEQFLIAGWL
jgi:hypothetical protein